jgi:hypothetical protein
LPPWHHAKAKPTIPALLIPLLTKPKMTLIDDETGKIPVPEKAI